MGEGRLPQNSAPMDVEDKRPRSSGKGIEMKRALRILLVMAVLAVEALDAPTFAYEEQWCRASARNGNSESICLLRQEGSFSRVSRNHAAGSSPLSFAVASKL